MPAFSAMHANFCIGHAYYRYVPVRSLPVHTNRTETSYPQQASKQASNNKHNKKDDKQHDYSVITPLLCYYLRYCSVFGLRDSLFQA
jgi:hypothetical protein